MKNAKSTKATTKKVETVKSTDKVTAKERKNYANKLQELQDAKTAATNALALYKAEFGKKYGVKGKKSTVIYDIIALHKKGKTNAQIIEAGFNKNTVKRQVGIYKKGKKTERTIAGQYLEVEEEGSEEGEDDGEGE